MANKYPYNEPILTVDNLRISFRSDEGPIHAVRGVSFTLNKGETLCIVGESGSGKSVTSKTIMGILPKSAVIESGTIMYEGEDLTKVDESEFHRIRGHKIGMIFQDPLSSLNPIMRVGKQITEAMLVNKNRLAQKYDDLISAEEAAYKNSKVKMKTAISQSQAKLNESDAFYDQEMAALNRALHDKKVALDTAKPKSPQEAQLAKEYALLSRDTKLEIAEISKKKKEDHKVLVKEAKAIKKEAKATYKKEAPALKKALDAKKKEAKFAIAKYKDDKKKEYLEGLVAVDAEEKELEDTLGAEISKLKKDYPNAPSKVAAKQVIDEKEKQYALHQGSLDKKRKDLKAVYVSSYKITRKEAKQAALKVMKEVGIPQPEVRYKQYPFEFSGGMRQRIVIAIALTANPEVLICDEPTTALDVTIQAQILELINNLKRDRHMSVIFITHDLGVVANMADRVAVMYAGKIVEVGTANEIFYDPRHPYTWALLSSIPDIDSKEKLEAIPGTPPYLLNPPKGDAFANRNKYALAVDFKDEPPFFRISETHSAATWLLDKRAPQVEKPRIVSQRIKASLERAGVHDVKDL
jgi:oligopeptide transport system ATP-binding protein